MHCPRPCWDWMSRARAGEPLARARILRIATRRTESANRRLVQQNEWMRSCTDEAQVLFLSATLCAGIAVLCYLFFGP